MKHLQNRKLKTKVIAPANVYNILREKLKDTNKEAILLQNLLNEYALIEFSEEKVKYQIQELLLNNADVKKFTYLNDFNFINRIYRLLDDIYARELSLDDLRVSIQSENMQNFELYKHLEILLDKKIETYSVFVRKIKELISKDIKEGKLELTYISDFYNSVEKKFLEDLNLKQDELEKEIFKESGQNPQAKYFKNMREEVEWIALNTTKENISETKLVLADSAYLPFVKSVFARHNIPIAYKETTSTFKHDLQVLLDYIISGRDKEILIENNFFKLGSINEVQNFFEISDNSDFLENIDEEEYKEVKIFNEKLVEYKKFLEKKENLDKVLIEAEKKLNIKNIIKLIDDSITRNKLETKFKYEVDRAIGNVIFDLGITSLNVETAKLFKSKLENINVKNKQEEKSVEIYTLAEVSPYKETSYILGTNINTYPSCKKDYALFEKIYTVLGLDDFEERYKNNVEDLKLHNKTAQNVVYTVAVNDLKGKSIYPARFDFEVEGLVNENPEDKKDKKTLSELLINLEENDYKPKNSDSKYNLGEDVVKSLFLKNLKDLKNRMVRDLLPKDKILEELTKKEKETILKTINEKISASEEADYKIYSETLEYYGVDKNFNTLEEFLDGEEGIYYIRTSVSRLKKFVDSPLSQFVEEVAGRIDDLDFDSAATRGTVQHKILEVLYSDEEFIQLIKEDKVEEISKKIEDTAEVVCQEYFKIYNKQTNKEIEKATFISNIKEVVNSLKEIDKVSAIEEQEYSFVVNISKYARDLDFSIDEELSLVILDELDIEEEYKENVFAKYPVFISGFIDRLVEKEDGSTSLMDYKSTAKSIKLPRRNDRFNQDHLDKIELQLLTYIVARAIEKSNSKEEYEELAEKIEAFYVTINSKYSKDVKEVKENRDINKISLPYEQKIKNATQYIVFLEDYYKLLSLRINKYILSGKIYKTHKDCVFTNDTFKVNIDSRGKRGEN